MKTIQSEITRVLTETQPKTKARNKALASVRWVLASEKGFCALQGVKIVFVPDVASAQVFDGRDSEETKASFYSAITKTACIPVLLP